MNPVYRIAKGSGQNSTFQFFLLVGVIANVASAELLKTVEYQSSKKPGRSIIIMSDSELEFQTGEKNFLLDYTTDGTRVRAVGVIDGSKQAIYYTIGEGKLISADGEEFRKAAKSASRATGIEADAENELRRIIEAQSKGKIELVRFAKKDGRKLEPSGYELLYEADVEFANDGVWMTGATLNTEIGFNFEERNGPEPTGLAAQFGIQVLKDAGGGMDVTQNSRRTISGSMVGQKYENAWKFRIGAAKIDATPSGSLSPKREDHAAEFNIAKLLLANVETALDTYRLNVGHYPTTKQGLDALYTRPAFENERLAQRWNGPYLKPGLKIDDPWGNPLQYKVRYISAPDETSGKAPGYTLFSAGPDGEPGTRDDIKATGSEAAAMRIDLPEILSTSLDSIKSTIENAATVEFHFVHPYSADLIAAQISAPGYQRLLLRNTNAETTTGYLVQRRPLLSLQHGDLTKVSIDPSSGGLTVSFQNKHIEDLREKLKEEKDRLVGIVVDKQLYFVPRMSHQFHFD